MRKEQRWAQIIDLCKNKDRILVEDLVKKLGVSEATIRRDLTAMEDLYMIKRFHGGLTLNKSQNNEPDIRIRNITNEKSKDIVARVAAKKIKDNQIVYIDSGSSALKMIDYIKAKNITVVTIGIDSIKKLIERDIYTVVLGGAVRNQTATITGNLTLKQLNDLYFDIAFLGVNAIHEYVGFTTTNESEALVKEKVIKRSAKTYLLADNSKFNKLTPVKFANLDDAYVISDAIDKFDKSLIHYELVNGETNIE